MIVMVCYALLALVIYTYVGFPCLVILRGWCARRPHRRESITPRITLIIACHNEETGIGKKLENVLSLDYPREHLEVLVASDGSTDRTESIASGFADRGVRLLRLPRGGKAPALNAAVQQASGEILAFSDANSLYSPDALRQLVQPFADPQVGGVAGNQVYRQSYNTGAAESGERSYWNFDRFLKTMESRAGNVISATGAIYAIRRSLFRPVPDGVTDDFVTSVGVIAQGHRLVFEQSAVCYEPVAGAVRAEFRRKTRVISRGLRGVWTMRGLLNPWCYGFYSLQLLSHKLLRRLVVIPLVLLAALTPCLWHEGWLFQVATITQAAFYGLALGGWLLSRCSVRVPKVCAIPFYFCLVNAAVLVAVWNIVRGRRIDRWDPERGSDLKAVSAEPRSTPISTLGAAR